jgi:ribulose-phosphate 3-epimerase
MLISPSVLNSNLGRLSEEIAKVEGVADLIHLDVMDNHFVPNLTFGLEVGAYSVTFHIEAAKDPRTLCKNIRSTGARAAAALKPQTNLDSLDGVLEHLDMILIMTVEPGFGGQAFMSDMMPKVARARELSGAKMWIEVDGGVSHNTIMECKEAGANVFVAGSCVYSNPDPAQVVRDLKLLVEN